MIVSISGEEYSIMPADVQRAMKAFDEGDWPRDSKWKTNPQFTRAVKQGRRYYPPKFLIVQITGIPGSQFNTKEALRILNDLGFTIVDKP
jgi:hypothetical protein